MSSGEFGDLESWVVTHPKAVFLSEAQRSRRICGCVLAPPAMSKNVRKIVSLLPNRPPTRHYLNPEPLGVYCLLCRLSVNQYAASFASSRRKTRSVSANAEQIASRITPRSFQSDKSGVSLDCSTLSSFSENR